MESGCASHLQLKGSSPSGSIRTGSGIHPISTLHPSREASYLCGTIALTLNSVQLTIRLQSRARVPASFRPTQTAHPESVLFQTRLKRRVIQTHVNEITCKSREYKDLLASLYTFPLPLCS